MMTVIGQGLDKVLNVVGGNELIMSFNDETPTKTKQEEDVSTKILQRWILIWQQCSVLNASLQAMDIVLAALC